MDHPTTASPLHHHDESTVSPRRLVSPLIVPGLIVGDGRQRGSIAVYVAFDAINGVVRPHWADLPPAPWRAER
jgi:hypothetical protein